MNKKTKILCVCRAGLIRSVGTKRRLNNRGYGDVLSAGSDFVSQETMDILCEWADTILLAKPHHGKNIKPEYQHKINKKFYIGDDLAETVKKQLDLIGL